MYSQITQGCNYYETCPSGHYREVAIIERWSYYRMVCLNRLHCIPVNTHYCYLLVQTGITVRVPVRACSTDRNRGEDKIPH